VPEREDLLARTFVELADTLVSDFDVVELLTLLTNRCVELFSVAGAGLLLMDPAGGVQVAASSEHRMELLDRFELEQQEGPCLDCFRSGEPVRSDDLRADVARWPRFVPEALHAGYGAAVAVPLRLRRQVIGAMNMLRVEPGIPEPADLLAAQALADVATIGLLQQRATEEQRILSVQLQRALDSRVVVEQAKGVLAAGTGLDVDGAFAALRRYARNRNERLSEVARALVVRTLSPDVIIADTGDR
jgi:transcriptional regulator with GAF, ATPase, and Fis domain